MVLYETWVLPQNSFQARVLRRFVKWKGVTWNDEEHIVKSFHLVRS